jgi:hypothetical protein
MKKLFLLVLCAFVLSTTLNAQTVIPSVDGKSNKSSVDTTTNVKLDDGTILYKSASNVLYTSMVSKKSGKYYRKYFPIIDSKTYEKTKYFPYYVAVYGTEEAQRIFNAKVRK